MREKICKKPEGYKRKPRWVEKCFEKTGGTSTLRSHRTVRPLNKGAPLQLFTRLPAVRPQCLCLLGIAVFTALAGDQLSAQNLTVCPLVSYQRFRQETLGTNFAFGLQAAYSSPARISVGVEATAGSSSSRVEVGGSTRTVDVQTSSVAIQADHPFVSFSGLVDLFVQAGGGAMKSKSGPETFSVDSGGKVSVPEQSEWRWTLSLGLAVGFNLSEVVEAIARPGVIWLSPFQIGRGSFVLTGGFRIVLL